MESSMLRICASLEKPLMGKRAIKANKNKTSRNKNNAGSSRNVKEIIINILRNNKREYISETSARCCLQKRQQSEKKKQLLEIKNVITII